MPSLLLKLTGPLQSWGDSSRFVNRNTRPEPTKSGVIGMLAAAQGRQRDETVADLTKLRFGVRVDQVGRLTRDFQTKIDGRSGKANPLTHRYYLADAKFLVVLEGELGLLDELARAIRSPRFPLYLGRRSCVPSQPLIIGIEDGEFEQLLMKYPWQAAEWYKKRQPTKLRLAFSRDALPSENPDEMIRDHPISYKQRSRKHELRPVIHGFTPLIENPDGKAGDNHRPFSLLGGA